MEGGCTYMVRCADGTLYTGWTNDLEKRLAAHNAGRGAKYTRSRRPVALVYAEEFATKEEAMSREARIKRMTRQEKEELVNVYGNRNSSERGCHPGGDGSGSPDPGRDPGTAEENDL